LAKRVKKKMASRQKSDLIKEILETLAGAADGDYTKHIAAGFPDDDLGRIAAAVNDLVQKTRDRMDRVGKEVKRHHHIIDNIQESYFEVDLRGNLLFFNKTLCQDLGYTPDEIQGIGFRALADERNAAKLHETFHRVFLTGRPVKGFDWEVLRKDKSKIMVEASVSLLRAEDGHPIGFRGVVRDISQRIQYQQDLQRSEEQYRTILDIMNEGYIESDLTGRITFVNDAACRLMGYSRGQLIGMHYREYLTEPVAKKMKNVFSEVYRSRKSRRLVDYDLVRPNQTVITYEMNIAPNTDATGNPSGFRVLFRDITERKKAEGEIREREKRYRTMTENVNDIVWVLDLNLRITYASPSNIRLTGYDPDEVVRMPLSELVAPASLQLAARVLAEELERETSGETVDANRSRNLQLEVYSRTGENIWLDVVATFNRDAGGRAVEILAVGRNITERRTMEKALAESERRYRMIVENVREVIWTADLNMRLTYTSPSCIHATGFTPAELMEMPLDRIMTPETLEETSRIVLEELALEQSAPSADPHRTRTVEQELYRKNGGTVWMEVTGTFIRDANGNAVGMLLAGRDITERKKAEAERNRLQAQLMQAQKMEIVGRLAGGVAHDFNNMLSVILGYVDLVKLRLGKQHPVRQDIVEIEKAAVRSRDLTAQLLAFSRKQIIIPRILDLNDLVAQTEKALIRLIGEDIDPQLIRTRNLWPIRFDPSQIEQILINLAVNARDAMPEGGSLTIETANVFADDSYCPDYPGLQPGRYVRMLFCDKGAGIDPETLPHIFEPFFTTKEVGKGTGLGLATVYGIVRQNDGHIHVESKPGQGSAFTIHLPSAPKAEEISAAREEEEAQPGGAGRILLVEDDAMVLQITRNMLESIGYEVTAAASPEEAIGLCRNRNREIDLVMTDVVMPQMSGKELRDRILEIRPDVRVMFMSGYPSDVIARQGVVEKGVLFLQKPFTIKSLAAKVAEAMED
jgi:PAS domain S-box-containing protein